MSSARHGLQALLGLSCEDGALFELTLSAFVLSCQTQCQAEMDLGSLCQPLAEAHA